MNRTVMKKIISIANQKGGVGKTTLTINLAAELANEGKKILVIDMDPQGNATSGLGVSKDRESTLYDVLIRGKPVMEVVTATPYANVSILPANMNLAGASVELAAMDFREFILKKAVDTLKPQFDFILMDTPPSLGLLTINAFVASDQILIPMQCEFFALEGISQMVKIYESMKGFANPNLEILGVVLCLVDQRMRLTEEVIKEIRNYFQDKVMKTIVPRNVRLAEAPSYGKTIRAYAPESKGATAFESLAKELLYGSEHINIDESLQQEDQTSASNNENADINTVTKERNYEKSSVGSGTFSTITFGAESCVTEIADGGRNTDIISVPISQ